MKPASFEYHRPASVAQALDLLAEHGAQAKLISGGQSLGPMMNMRLASPAHLIDINDLTELAGVRDVGDFLDIGTLTRHVEVEQSPLLAERCPLLPQAAGTIGHYAIRQRGTLGGSLAHADPAAQMALIACTLGARIVLASRAGEREVMASEFFEGAMTTALRADEMIVRVRYPRLATNERSAFRLFSRRHGDYALIAVAIVVGIQDEVVRTLRLGISGASPTPMRLDALTSTFLNQRPDDRWQQALGHAVSQAIEPEDDKRVPAIYRRELACELTCQALDTALAGSKKGVL
ncbi:MAG: xanthine dehydrogenase family protein subunit M [Burkholderiaceae bacterium]